MESLNNDVVAMQEKMAEIISNLNIIIENLKETCNCKQKGGEVMTSNDNNQLGDNREEVGLKQGVKECCEFVEVHATKGVI